MLAFTDVALYSKLDYFSLWPIWSGPAETIRAQCATVRLASCTISCSTALLLLGLEAHMHLLSLSLVFCYTTRLATFMIAACTYPVYADACRHYAGIHYQQSSLSDIE